MISLCDVFMMEPAAMQGIPWVPWLPVDCSRMGVQDAAKARGSAAQVAMSQFGRDRMREAGFDPFYVPHGIDVSVYAPPADQGKLRSEMGLPGDEFLIGINAANKGGPRKGIQEQMIAFSRFHERHPASKLMMHSFAEPRDGMNIRKLAGLLGIMDAIMLPDPYSYVTGIMDNAMIARWYGALDLLSNCSYGEGFGLPVLEAQSCGTPVVVTDFSSMPELCGAGWKVAGENWYIDGHDAFWMRPNIAAIDAAYESAWELREAGDSGVESQSGERMTMTQVRERAREFALQYDADVLLEEAWKPVLELLDERRPKLRRLNSGDLEKLPAAVPVEGKRDLMLVVPSRGRPGNVERLVAAVAETATMRTDIVFGFDLDDPELEANMAAAGNGHSGRVFYVTDERMSLAGWTNKLAAEWAEDYTALGSFGDDHVPQTPGWDAELLKALADSGPGFAYPNDKVREDVPEAYVMSSEIVAALGWMCEPSLQHFFVDNVIADLGQHAQCITYLPDVVVEHMHHLHKPGEVKRDKTYQESETKIAADQAAYEKWRNEGLAGDVEKIRKVREVAGK